MFNFAIGAILGFVIGMNLVAVAGDKADKFGSPAWIERQQADQRQQMYFQKQEALTRSSKDPC